MRLRLYSESRIISKVADAAAPKKSLAREKLPRQTPTTFSHSTSIFNHLQVPDNTQQHLHSQSPLAHFHSTAKMRPLTETETQTLFAKLANYTGNSLKNLIAPLDNGPSADRYVFRLHQSRCYYVRLSLANLATSISRDKLLSLGTCLGTFNSFPTETSC